MGYENRQKEAFKLQNAPSDGIEIIVRVQIYPELKEPGHMKDKKLDPDDVIAWLRSFGCDVEHLVSSFKKHFEL